MSTSILAVVFVISVGAMTVASARMTDTLERIGSRLRFPEALLGLYPQALLELLSAAPPASCSSWLAASAGR